MPRTVWILGAGFPRSLGAPLLADLFRQEEPFDVRAYFPEQAFPGLAEDLMAAQIAFNWGRTVDHLWDDAEQFLVFVDDALEGNSSEKQQRLKNLTDRARRKAVSTHEVFYYSHESDASRYLARGLQRASRRALAAETSRFMMTNRDGELWLPYREWAAGLRAEDDTIITFNYDVLLDELGKRAPFTIPLPHEDPEQGKIPVLKLHGSANWQATGATYLRLGDYEVLTHPSGLYPAIAAPGRSKSPEGEAPFPRLWEIAERAIEQAQWVIFVGYRFPPTDALARVRLSRALAKRNGFAVRRVDTVLGPNIASNESARLQTLIWAARGNRRLDDTPITKGGDRTLIIRQQRLWAEDFLTTYQDVIRDQDWSIDWNDGAARW